MAAAGGEVVVSRHAGESNGREVMQSIAGSGLMLAVQAFSEAGGHPLNEDAFVVRQHPRDQELWLCFVADGQGGQAGGGPAARLACQAALEIAAGCAPDGLDAPPMWSGILRSVDEAVRADPAAGYTTLVGLCVRRHRLVGVSSGDSAALLVCGERAVELSSGQHKNPPVGSGMAVMVPFVQALKGPWQILAISDGVWKYVGWDRIVAAARRETGMALVAKLQQAARLPSSGKFQDDFTVVVLEGAA